MRLFIFNLRGWKIMGDSQNVVWLDEYQRQTKRTVNDTLDPVQRITSYGLGVAGEAGEVADDIKKWYAHGDADALPQLREELGDLLWYVARLADELDLSLSDIATKNIAKLKKRYPQGFSAEDSKARVDHAEK
jgi:NTP pyrophosphatase (non-canonical NTP hydrolase)